MTGGGKITRLLLLLMAFVLSASCQRRPLEDMNTGVWLDLDLDLEVLNHDGPLPTPELMRVLFYDAETEEFISDDYVLPEGGYVSAQPGRYKMLVYNFDTQSTLIRNDSWVPTIEAYTSEIPTSTRTSLLTKLSNSTRPDFEAPKPSDIIVYEPDHLLVGREEVEIVRTTGTQTIYASASSIVETYYLAVRLHNGDHVASAQALLSGQAKSNKFGHPGGRSDEPVTLYFTMTPGKNDRTGEEVLHTTFNTFGKIPSEISNLWLTIIVTDKNGTVITWHKDITEEFVDNHERYIYLEEEPIPIPDPPDPPSVGGGFQPSVDDWEEVNQDIHI